MVARFRNQSVSRPAFGGLLLVFLMNIGQTDVAGESRRPSGRRVTPIPSKAEPLKGVCVDEKDQPLAGVKVGLYRDDYGARKPEKIGEQETGVDGRFEFPNVLIPGDEHGLGIVVTKTGRGSIVQRLFAGHIPTPLEFRLRPAGTLQGRVTDESGKPVAGARVWAHSLRTGPIDDVANAVTDSEGKYAITDMGRWTDEDAKPKPIGKNLMAASAGAFFDVRHPNFAGERPTWIRIPATVNVVLHPGGVIEGKVSDQVTGKPAAGVIVSLQGIKGMPTFGQTVTGTDGTYQIRCLKAGNYNLWADATDRACAAIDSLTVTAGKTLTAQNLTLVEGGWIEGRIVDSTTGKPITGTPKRPLHVACYGPGRPRSGAACQSAPVDEKGKFRMRVAPGLNHPYIMTSEMWLQRQGQSVFETGVNVKAGETTALDFQVQPPHAR